MAEKGNAINIKHVDVEDPIIKKRNLWFYPLGTVGRDMIYTMFTSFIFLYVLYTKELTDGQVVAITMIMVAARIFDAFNDPIMGNIIERTRTKWGKFKPWLLIGSLSTSIVVYLAFNTKLTGWAFVTFFGIIYFLYSITFTMNDISYWGMVPAVSRTSDSRNQFTSRATLFAGVGSTLAGLMIPMLTAGTLQISGNASTAYGIIALVIGILSPLFVLFTLFGVKENRDDMEKPADKVSFKLIADTIFGNDQLRWMVLIYLLHQIGNNLIIGGIGANYVYFRYGYEGGLYSLFSTVGMAATAFLMIFYPSISRKLSRKTFLKVLLYVAIVGCILMLVSGLVMPANMAGFWVLTIGYMLLAFGLYGYHLVLMISIFNTVEYNELKKGSRREGIITSIRPFITKLGCALVVVITSLCYLLFRVTDYTNQIAGFEQAANQNLISTETKNAEIAKVIMNVGKGQSIGMLLFMVIVPFALLLISYLLYKRFYKLDEAKYAEIVSELEKRNKTV
ncbi:MAG: MFS transporter [Spirochaetaceae bacterium]|nr:MFS transporter [Spirochaetaceae bacterium]